MRALPRTHLASGDVEQEVDVPRVLPLLQELCELPHQVRLDPAARERELFIANLLVQIHFIIVMIGWTCLASWEFELPFPGSPTSTFLVSRDFRLNTRDRVLSKVDRFVPEIQRVSFGICRLKWVLPEREFCVGNLLVRIHCVIVMIRWTGLAPLEV